MRSQWHTHYRKALMAAVFSGLLVLGLHTSCEDNPLDNEETPMARFIVTGNVSSLSGDPLNDILVIMQGDTTYTDVFGDYSVSHIAPPVTRSYQVRFSDVDGFYMVVDTTVTFTDPQFENENGGWFVGEASLEVDITLKKEI